jgi:trk system potassium uptake protein TrkH
MNRIFNLKLITSFLGLSIMLNGLVMLLTTPVALYFEEECWLSIAASGALTLTLGFFMWFLNRDAVKNLQNRDGYLIVVLGWLMLTLTGTLPYVISGSIPNFTDAFF